MKKNCYSCAYKGSVPGSAHSSCRFNWTKSNNKPPSAAIHGIQSGWYNFPIDFDPVWQESLCESYSTEKEPGMIVDPFESLFKMLFR
jgi:hypothetical protein